MVCTVPSSTIVLYPHSNRMADTTLSRVKGHKNSQTDKRPCFKIGVKASKGDKQRGSLRVRQSSVIQLKTHLFYLKKKYSLHLSLHFRTHLLTLYNGRYYYGTVLSTYYPQSLIDYYFYF